MNMHVHLGLNLPGAARLVNETDPQMVLRMAKNARLSLLSGVTTIRSVGENNGNDFALKAAIERGDAVGPRWVTAGMSVVPPAVTAATKPMVRMRWPRRCASRSKRARAGSRSESRAASPTRMATLKRRR